MQKNEFNLSVIIPVYNAGKYIQKAVESALAQPETGEVIIVDDKSGDNSFQLCTDLAQSESLIKLYQHPDKQNHGAGATRNLGIAKASFDYISFLDADDYFLPGRFKKDKELFAEFPDIDGVYNAVGTDYYEKVENAMIPQNFITTITKKLNPKDLLHSLITTENGWIHSNGVTVKRRVFEKSGVFDPALRLAQDSHLWIRVAATCVLIGGETNQPVAMRGVHGQNRVNNIEVLYQSKRLMFSKLLNWAIEKKLPLDKKRLFWKNYYLLNIDYVKRSNRQRLTDTLAELFKYPFLLGYRDFYQFFPFLARFVK